MIISVQTGKGTYPVILERGALKKAGEYLSLKRKCLIVTDENIPFSFVETLTAQCAEPHLFTLRSGEESKSLESFERLLAVMLENDFSRTDCVVALGGGVVGDLAGFVAASYLRGVDFYNVPTTLLSQVDSSIGGKVAVNFMGLKNMVGAFYPPAAVLVDPETLSTLPRRQLANGLAEAVKMALTFDADLFALFETGEIEEKIDLIIEKSLRAKKMVVEADEREGGLRKVLNFGHTLAHAIESESLGGQDSLYHGECVALGMIPMCSSEVRERLIPVLEKLGLPTRMESDPEVLLAAMRHDKKTEGDAITVIRVEKIGEYVMEKMPFSRFAEEVKGGIK